MVDQNKVIEKYSLISDASSIFVDTVVELANSAVQAIKEGGSEVYEEVPFLYTCVDVTAMKARNWAYRRVQLHSNPQQVVGGSTPAEACDAQALADDAEKVVRQAFLLAEEGKPITTIKNAKHSPTQQEHQKQLRHRDSQDHYYFYQSKDGQQVFLLPLNAKCLLAEYGSWEMCPRRVVGKVIQMEEYVQGEAERKRWKFLSHLPLSSNFKFCEIAMSQEEYAGCSTYYEELQKRQRKRDRMVKQQADEDAAQQEYSSFLDLPPSSSYTLAPTQEDWQSMPLPSGENGSFARENREASSPPRPGVSFANITKMGYAANSSKEKSNLRQPAQEVMEQNAELGKNSENVKQGKKTFKGKIKGRKLVLSSIQRKY
eukprot:TRINITY_DN2435_c0_g1_i3.p1 TRINITY_DN2435_c0_g1~~TRINITY_DN2435_c0_g1_i3.p1  ORF type:complete len:427 (+),score=75.32 TRINITY_DN2435_c0_g1_i3:168-1283(+)